jgi:hypothetical protein
MKYATRAVAFSADARFRGLGSFFDLFLGLRPRLYAATCSAGLILWDAPFRFRFLTLLPRIDIGRDAKQILRKYVSKI